MDKVVKFRTYDTQAQKMLFWDKDNQDFLLKFCLSTQHNYKIMQYIGTKDKNKQEVYEGDICIYINQKGQHIGEVKWINTLNAFRLVFVDREEFFFISNDNEIIGNRFENPELLEKR
ncbi:YopX family protein [Sulfurimonas sp.]